MRGERASRVVSTAYLVGEKAAVRRPLDETAGMTRVSVIITRVSVIRTRLSVIMTWFPS